MLRDWRLPLCCIAVITSVYLAVATSNVCAQTQTSRELDELRKNLQRQDAKVREDSAKAGVLLRELRSMDKDLLDSASRREQLLADEEELEEEYRDRVGRLEVLQTERDAVRDIVGQRLASIYKRGRLGSNRAFAQAATSSEPLRMARYLAAISQTDNSVFAAYDDVRQRHEEAIADLEDKKIQIQDMKAALDDEADHYEERRGEKKRLLASLEKDIERTKVAKEHLLAAAAELTKIIEADAARAAKEAENKRLALARAKAVQVGPFSSKKGKLDAPVHGKVIRKYGDKLEGGAKLHGVIVDVAGDSRVAAIAPGKVVFAGPFPGLGKTIIINHGGRYHSVYAGLDKLNHEVGQRVRATEVVGTLDKRDPTLHFELRAEGRPMDPSPWLRSGYDAFK